MRDPQLVDTLQVHRFHLTTKSERGRVMTRLDQLPSEVLHQIIDHLTVSDLLSLTRVNKALRPFAETRLWRSIKLLVPPGAPFGDAPYASDNMKWSDDRLTRLLAGLDGRAQYIRNVQCQVTRSNKKDLFTAIKASASHMTRLQIYAAPSKILYSEEDQTVATSLLATDLAESQIRFDSLQTLVIPLERHCESLFFYILSAAPNLHTLHIDRMRHAQWAPNRLPQFPTLLRLRTLRVEHVAAEHVPALSQILDNSPMLNTVCLKKVLWNHNKWTWRTWLRGKLGEIPLLHTLEIDRTFWKDVRYPSFQSLRFLRLRHEYRNCFSTAFAVSLRLCVRDPRAKRRRILTSPPCLD
jgi:hypothetical protein